MEHQLKIWPEHFDKLRAGVKRFEIRKDDRPYGVGDLLRLDEWDSIKAIYTGRTMYWHVTYVLRDAEAFGLMPGFCVLSIEPRDMEARR